MHMIQESFHIHPYSSFRLDLTVWALRRRGHNQVDRWNGTPYTRVLLIDQVPVKVEVSQLHPASPPHLLVNVWSTAPGVDLSTRVKEILQRMLGFSLDLTGFYALSRYDPAVSPLAQKFVGMKPLRFPSFFETLLNAFACQQVTLDVGLLLLNRLTEAYGKPFVDSQTVRAFPRPEEITTASIGNLRALGFSRQKARAMIELATRLTQEPHMMSPLEGMNNEEMVATLSSLRGVGRWTAEYVLLRGLGRLETFPGDDVGAQRNIQRLLHLPEKPTYEMIKALIASWSPYAGLIYFHLLLEALEKKGVVEAAQHSLSQVCASNAGRISC